MARMAGWLNGVTTALRLGNEILAIAAAIKEAKTESSEGGRAISRSERLVIYRLLVDLLVKAGADRSDFPMEEVVGAEILESLENAMRAKVHRFNDQPLQVWSTLDAPTAELPSEPVEG